MTPPRLLGGHYRVERELGRGGMATVFLCTDTRNMSAVAVKLLRSEVSNAVTTERFLREIQIVSELVHPRIPKVLASGMHEKRPFYAMTYVDGESLRDRMIRESPMPVSETIRIASQVLESMDYAHAKGILHRDIKPENILLARNDVYVLDFGIARAIIRSAGDRLTSTGVTVGTPAYMSPEQALADTDLDARSDVYSLGCVLFEMLSGEPPFTGRTPEVLMARRFSATPRPIRTLRPEVHPAIEAALTKALSRAADERWPTAAQFRDALISADSEAAAEALHASPTEENLLEKLRVTFADTYKVESELSGGGMSRLFLATDLGLQRRVVIKILPPELTSQMMLARFKRESEVTARLQHPHILPVISAGVRDGLVHYIMPFIEGESLRNRLQREGQLPVTDAVRLLREVSDALAYAHKQGIIHRDIKPENILIQDGHAVLADFGIAAALSGLGTQSGERLTGTGMSLGTVGYMAPEQALGEKNVDARADIYAVGVVGYEMFAGAPPFVGATDQAILVAHLTKEAVRLDDVRQDTPPAIAETIKRALQKDPASRYQTAAELRDALDLVGSAANRQSRPLKLTRLRAVPRKWTVAGLAVVLTVAGVTAIVLRNRGPTGPAEQVTIAVAPFNALSSSLSLWREGMVDVLARNLDGAGPLRTISPTLSIKGFTGAADRRSALELARRTNAHYAIFGTLVGSANDSVRLR
ncbi:MAG TPA: serine/threonine-protein kinase, partial [Gemmatimonadaceae bacterium]|nr:serine/threonine-protein kinase [Gemmatimonadaceae bacterium]